MEVQIQDLITSIRDEGVTVANVEAESIVAEAKRKAKKIVAEASAEAKITKVSSEKEIELMREGIAASAEQAKRDAMLAFKQELQKEYEKLLSENVKKVLAGESLAVLIKAALADEDLAKYEIQVAEVSDALKSELAEEIRNGLVIRPTKGVKAGFRLADKDGSGYFDCTDEEITQMLMPYFRNINF